MHVNEVGNSQHTTLINPEEKDTTPASNFNVSSINSSAPTQDCFFSLIVKIWEGVVYLFKTIFCFRTSSQDSKVSSKLEIEPAADRAEPQKDAKNGPTTNVSTDESSIPVSSDDLAAPVSNESLEVKDFKLETESTDNRTQTETNPEPTANAGDLIVLPLRSRTSVAITTAAATLPSNRREPLDLAKILQELEGLYEVILADLKKIALAEGKQLFNQLKALYQNQVFEWTRMSEDPNTDPKDLERIARILAIEENFFYLRSLRCALFMRKFGINDNGVVEVPGDGNCLYHSVLEKLVLFKLVRVKTSHVDLREKVVSWLEQHKDDPQLITDLQDSINAYREMEKERIEFRLSSDKKALENESEFLTLDEIKQCLKEFEDTEKELENLNLLNVSTYLEHAKKPGFFSGGAELYALSKIFDITIRVRQLLNHQQLDPGSDRIFNEGKENKITLLYEMDGAHFNLQLID